MSDAVDLQRLARLVELNRSQLNALGEQIQRLESGAEEHREVISALESLDNEERGRTMVPLGAGVQLPVKLPDNPGVVVDIGSGIQAERELSDAIGIMSKRLDEIDKLISTLSKEFTSTEEKVKQLASEFTSGAEALEGELPEEPTETESEDDDRKPTKRRRRSIGGELTLDD